MGAELQKTPRSQVRNGRKRGQDEMCARGHVMGMPPLLIQLHSKERKGLARLAMHLTRHSPLCIPSPSALCAQVMVSVVSQSTEDAQRHRRGYNVLTSEGWGRGSSKAGQDRQFQRDPPRQATT